MRGVHTSDSRVEDERGSPDGFHIRAAAFLPVRVGYSHQVLVDHLGLDPAATRVLVVGAGRGLLARELARLGFVVTALDPSADAVQRAQQTADRHRLTIGHQQGDARQLPAPASAFDVAYYADTFEITEDLDGVLAEAARVLRPGGVLLYDTVNRSRLSRLIYLHAFQSWRWTRIAPPDRYSWDRLRPPGELAATLAAHELHNQDIRGFLPASPLRLVRATLRARRGQIDDAELAQMAGMHLAEPGKPAPVTYIGYAAKQA